MLDVNPPPQTMEIIFLPLISSFKWRSKKCSYVPHYLQQCYVKWITTKSVYYWRIYTLM